MKKLIGYLCTVSVAAATLLAPISAKALTPNYAVSSPSEAYMSGDYYRRLTEYELTGDMRYDVVSIALTQLGYHEGNGEGDFHGNNQNGCLNFVEYNRNFGKVDNGEGNGVSYGYMWCCSFASWCLRQARVPQDVAVNAISCPSAYSWYLSQSAFKSRNSGYVPKAGDLVLFKNGNDYSVTDHVGIVISSDGYTVKTIEGNKSNKIGLFQYLLKDTCIVGYCVPQYTVKEGTTYDFGELSFPEASLLTGLYRSCSDKVNVYGDAEGSKIVGMLDEDEVTRVTNVCQGERLEIEFENGTGYVRKSDMIFIGDDVNEIKFVPLDCNGETTTVLKAKNGKLRLPNVAFSRDGDELLGWSEARYGKSVEYKAGDVISDNRDVILFPVWASAVETTASATQAVATPAPDAEASGCRASFDASLAPVAVAAALAAIKKRSPKKRK